MNTFGVAKIFAVPAIAVRRTGKDACLRLHVNVVRLEHAYGLQNKKILKDFRTPQKIFASFVHPNN